MVINKNKCRIRKVEQSKIKKKNWKNSLKLLKKIHQMNSPKHIVRKSAPYPISFSQSQLKGSHIVYNVFYCIVYII